MKPIVIQFNYKDRPSEYVTTDTILSGICEYERRYGTHDGMKEFRSDLYKIWVNGKVTEAQTANQVIRFNRNGEPTVRDRIKPAAEPEDGK